MHGWWRQRAQNLMVKASLYARGIENFRLSPKMQSDCGPTLGLHMMIANRHIMSISGHRNEQSITDYNCRPFTENKSTAAGKFSPIWRLLLLQLQLNQKVYPPKWRKQTVWILNFLKQYFKTEDTINQVQASSLRCRIAAKLVNELLSVLICFWTVCLLRQIFTISCNLWQ